MKQSGRFLGEEGGKGRTKSERGKGETVKVEGLWEERRGEEKRLEEWRGEERRGGGRGGGGSKSTDAYHIIQSISDESEGPPQ